MEDETIARRLATLRERWTAARIAYDRPATDADVAAFETRYGVVLPSDIRAYFTTLNGTANGKYGIQDEYLLGFWHFDEVRSFAELSEGSGAATSEQERTFAIADYSIWVHGFGIQLSADPGAPTPVVVDFGSPYQGVAGAPYQRVASSFSDFLDAYLRGDQDVIYPDPKDAPSTSHRS
jgi:cell wall assembly regulator SMI1